MSKYARKMILFSTAYFLSSCSGSSLTTKTETGASRSKGKFAVNIPTNDGFINARLLEISWPEAGDYKSYTIKIANDENCQDIVLTSTTKEKTLAITSMPPGEYFVCFEAEKFNGGTYVPELSTKKITLIDAVPAYSPTDLSFSDNDSSEGHLTGIISIGRPIGFESSISGYDVYWAAADGSEIALVKSFKKSDADLSFDLSATIPAGAVSLRAVSRNPLGRSNNPKILSIVDSFTPTDLPINIAFSDTDIDAGEIGGNLVITPASSELKIDGYEIYWGSNATTVLSPMTAPNAPAYMPFVAKTGSNISIAIGPNLAVPSGATHILAFSKRGDLISASSVSVLISSNGAPPTPGNFTATATSASSTSIDLAWADVAGETSYDIERSPDGTNGWTSVGTPVANAVSFPNIGLTAATTYYYRIKSVNAGGSSAYSATASRSTNAVAPSTPGSFTATATAASSTSIDLAWADVAGETSYDIERSPDGTNGWTSVGTPVANAVSFPNTGLTAATTYYYRIKSVNAGGSSSYSTTASTSTNAAAPPTPGSFTATATSASSTSIDLAWADVAGETSYDIEKSPNGSTGWTSVNTPAANAVSYANTGLTASTIYYYRVKAVNAGGSSAYSTTASATTNSGAPPTPGSFTATATSASSTSIDLAWTDVAGETSYDIERSPNGSTGWTSINTPAANAVSYANAGLTAATVYYYRIKAVNAGGPSSYSTTASTSTNAAAPSAPGSFTATATAASSTSIDLAWADVAGETSYDIERSPNGSTGWTSVNTPAANAVSYANTGLTAATTYYYRIKAVNAGGSSSYSTTASRSTNAAAPPAPGTFTATATAASSTSINLAWTDVAGETSYDIERSPNGSTGWTSVNTPAANAVSYVNTGLAAATTYYYRIKAVNAGGSSSYSTTASTSTNAAAPPTPGSFTATATASSSTSIDLAWADVAGETSYDIERSLNGSTGWTSISTSAANAVSYANTGLTVATAYYYRIKAVNAGGSSSYSTTVSTSTNAAAPPTPGSLTATAVSSTSIDLAWTDVAGETSYDIERSPNGSTGWTSVNTPAANAVSYANTGLTASTIYYYRVKAVNAGGSSAYSTTASATTNSGAPATPGSFTATATSASSTSIDLAWADVAGETSYDIERSPNGSTGWTSVNTPAANAVSYANTGLTASTIYYYRVKAVNAGGSSSYSTTASATTNPGAPATPGSFTATATSASSTSIDLAWADVAGETSYDIERSPNGSTGWTSVGTPAANAVSYANTGLTAATAYYYRIKAVNAGGSSAYSLLVTGLTNAAAPPAPGSFTATATAASSTSINLAWADVASETSYDIERSLTGSSGWASINTPVANAVSYPNTGLTASTTYYYRIKAVNAGGSSAYSANASATTNAGAPATPGSFTATATAASSTSIDLTWTDVADETSYDIERSLTGSSGWTSINTPTANAVSYPNIGLTASTTYYYRIKAVNAGGSSAYSANASATTNAGAPPTPGSVTATATAASSTAIDLAWADVADETSYDIERSPNGSTGWISINTPAANTVSYPNTGLTASTTYYYRIKAVNAGGSSSYSSTANATTNAGAVDFSSINGGCSGTPNGGAPNGVRENKANAFGLGTPANPYRICEPEQLIDMQNTLASGENYLQMKDIDMNNDPAFVPLAFNQVVYDGNHFKISNLKVENSSGKSASFIYNFDDSILKNITFENLDLSHTSLDAGLAGYTGENSASTMINVHITGASYIEGKSSVGGLMTIVSLGASIKNCSVDAALTLNGNGSIGGLIGNDGSGSPISDSSVRGSISTSSTASEIGGAIGYSSSNTTYENIFVGVDMASIANSSSNNVGGLIGSSADSAIRLGNIVVAAKLPSNSSVKGGLIGKINTFSNDAEVTTASYFDNSPTMANTTAAVGSGAFDVGGGLVYDLVTADMKNATLTTGLNYSGSHWYIDDGNAYPGLVRIKGGCDQAFAAGQTYSTYNAIGTGITTDPYLICTPAQFNNIGGSACGAGGVTKCDKNFVLGTDIDMSAIVGNHNMIGSSGDAFTGTFDGQNHVIDGFTHTSTDSDIGIFRRFEPASVGLSLRSLGVVNLNLSGNNGIGGLVAVWNQTATGSLQIVNVYTEGTISGTATLASHGFVGGLLGQVLAGTEIITAIDIYSKVDITWDNNGQMGTGNIGGLVGSATQIQIYDSYFDGSITLNGTTGTTNNIGGIIGQSYESNFKRLYSKGTIADNSAVEASSVGGLFGYAADVGFTDVYSQMTITDLDSSMLQVGGLAGRVSACTADYVYAVTALPGASNSGAISGDNNCTFGSTYWDEDIMVGIIEDFLGDPGAGFNRTTTFMQTGTNYTGAGWDFTNTWKINEGTDYPKFIWEQ